MLGVWPFTATSVMAKLFKSWYYFVSPGAPAAAQCRARAEIYSMQSDWNKPKILAVDKRLPCCSCAARAIDFAEYFVQVRRDRERKVAYNYMPNAWRWRYIAYKTKKTTLHVHSSTKYLMPRNREKMPNSKSQMSNRDARFDENMESASERPSNLFCFEHSASDGCVFNVSNDQLQSNAMRAREWCMHKIVKQIFIFIFSVSCATREEVESEM